MLRFFHLIRDVDKTGVSGTGKVAVGAVSDEDGQEICVLTWLTKKPEDLNATVYCSLKRLEEVHCHEGLSHLVWFEAGEAFESDEVFVEALGLISSACGEWGMH